MYAIVSMQFHFNEEKNEENSEKNEPTPSAFHLMAWNDLRVTTTTYKKVTSRIQKRRQPEITRQWKMNKWK